MFKFSTGDVCMIKYAPEAYDELNGYVVKTTQASLMNGVESWYTEETIPNIFGKNIFSEISFPLPESWLWKFGTEKEKK